MKYFLSKKREIFIVVLLVCLVSFVYYNKATFSQKLSTQSSVSESAILIPFSTSTEEIKTGPPLRLQIPILGVDAEIEYVGLNSAGEMDVPKNPDNVAWFSLGSLPGAEGSAVMAGHFDDKNGEAAIFYKLEDLKKGDEVLVENDQGGVITFIVREARIYESEAFAPEVFVSEEGKHLNLITCTGNWNQSKESYTKRLIVFTDIAP